PDAPVDVEVLEASGVAEIIEALPDGLDSPVRDSGSNLSGGQRQTLALARALHANAEVLVLNDPTSAVASVTEVSIAQGVYDYRAAKATLVLSTSPAFQHLSDEVITLTPILPSAGPQQSFTTALHRLNPYRLRLIGVLILGLITAVCGLIGPWAVGVVVDKLLVTPDFRQVLGYCLIIVVGGIIAAVGTWWSS